MTAGWTMPSNPERQAELAAMAYRDGLARKLSGLDAVRRGLLAGLLSRPGRTLIYGEALRHAQAVAAVALGHNGDFEAFGVALKAYRWRAAELRGERERELARARAAQQQAVAP